MPAVLTVSDLIAQIALQELPDLQKIIHAAVDALAGKSIAPAINAALQAVEVSADAIQAAKFGTPPTAG